MGISDEDLEFNKAMSSVREAVEWGFGKVSNIFSNCCWRKGQRVFVSPVALQYKVAMFMANVHTCLNGHQTADYFDCEPPSLAAYLAGTAC